MIKNTHLGHCSNWVIQSRNKFWTFTFEPDFRVKIIKHVSSIPGLARLDSNAGIRLSSFIKFRAPVVSSVAWARTLERASSATLDASTQPRWASIPPPACFVRAATSVTPRGSKSRRVPAPKASSVPVGNQAPIPKMEPVLADVSVRVSPTDPWTALLGTTAQLDKHRSRAPRGSCASRAPTRRRQNPKAPNARRAPSVQLGPSRRCFAPRAA